MSAVQGSLTGASHAGFGSGAFSGLAGSVLGDGLLRAAGGRLPVSHPCPAPARHALGGAVMTREQLRLRREIVACGRQCERWAAREFQSRRVCLFGLERGAAALCDLASARAFAAARELARVSS